ncbi:putative RNA-directed DNA polymerase, partial [Tanacetum coccineum]
MVEGDKPPKHKGISSGYGENSINQYDPLFLHSNDTNGVPIIGFKLEDTKNYKFLMGLDEIYAPIRSIILTTDPIPDVKEAFATLSRDESHRGSLSHSTLKTGNSAFVARPNTRNNNWNNNNNNNQSKRYPPNFKNNNSGFNKGASSSNSVSGSKDQSTSNSFTDDQFKKLMALISDKSRSNSMPANIVASQHMTYIVLNMFNVVEISKLNITIGHPNGTKAVVTHMSSLRLTDQIVIHDVLVVPGYEDSVQRTQVRTGSESNGLLGHPADQVLNILNTKLDFGKDNGDNVCDVCHKAKQTRDPFPLSEHKSKFLGQLVHLDVWGPYKVQSKEGYKSSEPYDDRRDKEPEVSEGTCHMSSGGTENTGNTRRDEGKHPDDSEPAEAEFNEMFESPNVIPNSQSEVNLRRSFRKTSMPKRFSDFKVDTKVKYSIDKHVNYSNLSVEKFNFSTSMNKTIEPKTFDEASKDIRWIEAMNLEMEALNRNGTWIITELHVRKKLIGNKWVWKVKYKSTGDVERCIFSLAVFNGWCVYQLDDNNAFLYGDLEEDVYKSLPEGYFSKDDKRVCKLVKSLYGLKQAHRKWNEKVTSVLLENNFKQSNNSVEIDKFKVFLSSKFMIKDLGKLKYFLGIKVLENNEGLVLTQRKYCLELLTEFGMLGCKPCGTPIESKEGVVKLSKGKVADTDYPLTRINNYQKLVGKLIYLTHTRPDISYAVHVLSQFKHAPLQSHLKLAFRVLRYLKTAPGKGISFNKGSDLNLKVKKQSMLSKSSAEAEYRAMNSVTCEVMWILKILTELNVNISLPVPLHCDNSSALQIAANPIKSADNTADIFTKGLSVIDHNKFCKNLGLKDLYRISLRGNIENFNPNPRQRTKGESKLNSTGIRLLNQISFNLLEIKLTLMLFREYPRSRIEGVFPPNIARPLHGVKLLGETASVDFDFSSEIVMKRVDKAIGLIDAVAKINDPQCELLLLRAYTDDVLNYAFLASRLQSASLQTMLLRYSGIVSSRPSFDDALRVFNMNIETGLLSNPSEIVAPKLMKKLANIYFTRVTQTAKPTFSLSPRHMSLWQSQMEDHTSDWLRVVPISSLGHTMNGSVWGYLWRPCCIMCRLDGGCDKLLRPADMLLYLWDGRLDVCVDLTRSSLLTQIGLVDFVPDRVVSDAAHQADAVILLKRIRKFFMAQNIEARVAVHIFNRISFAIAKGEATLCMGTIQYREDSNETAFAVPVVGKIYAHESLTFNNTVACEAISKWKVGLKDDMDARSNVYVLSNGYKKCSDDGDGYYWESTPVGSQEYQMVCTRLDIASADVGMLDNFDRGLQTDVQVFVDFDYAMAAYMTLTGAWKKEIWLKGLLAESGYELSLVAGIATGALVKGSSRSEVPAQVEGV